MRIGVEAWATDYGAEATFGGLLDVTEEDVDTSCETADWGPLSPHADMDTGATTVVFVDGTRRVDARVFVSERATTPSPGIAGSVGVGAVACELSGAGEWWVPRSANISDTEIRRVLVMGDGRTLELVASPGLEYEAMSHPGNDEEALVNVIHDRMRAMEAALAQQLADEETIVFVDGPLAVMRPDPQRIVGFIKAHHRRYLDEDHEKTLSALDCGQRTPLFAFGEPRPRYSWYLRLCPLDDHDHSWHGVVRCETPASLGLPAAVALADASCAILPGFASTPGWDPRAPQNLVPVAGLEKRLRHLLGDRDLVVRMIRSAARRKSLEEEEDLRAAG